MKEKLKLYLVTDRDLSLGRPLEEIVSEAVTKYNFNFSFMFFQYEILRFAQDESVTQSDKR